MEEFKIVVTDKFDFEKLDVIVDSAFGIFGKWRMRKKRTTYGLDFQF